MTIRFFTMVYSMGGQLRLRVVEYLNPRISDNNLNKTNNEIPNRFARLLCLCGNSNMCVLVVVMESSLFHLSNLMHTITCCTSVDNLVRVHRCISVILCTRGTVSGSLGCFRSAIL